MSGSIFFCRLCASGCLIASGATHGETRVHFLGIAIVAALWEVSSRLGSRTDTGSQG